MLPSRHASDSMIRRVVEAISRRPVVSLVALAAALAPLIVASAGLRPDNSLNSWFVDGDPALVSYHAFLKEYGNDEAILIGFDTPGGAHSREEVEVQSRIAARLAAIDGVERVLIGGALP